MAGAPWALAQYSDGSSPVLGVLVDGGIRAVPAGWPRTSLELFDDWASWRDRLRDLDPDVLEPVEHAGIAAPITFPRKVLCAGANFYDHAEEMGTARPDPRDAPFFFLKPPTTTIVGDGTVVDVSGLEAAELDWEGELAVVIADRCRDLADEEAPAHIAGYTVANDLSARGRFPRPNAVLAPFAFDWLAHKGFDGSCPIGPGIVPAFLVGDPGSLSLRTTVDGVVKQDSSTASMVVPVAALVAAASRLVTLEPGDVVLTGTPAGVGMPRREFLHDGAVVRVEIEGIGVLENRIRAA